MAWPRVITRGKLQGERYASRKEYRTALSRAYGYPSEKTRRTSFEKLIPKPPHGRRAYQASNPIERLKRLAPGSRERREAAQDEAVRLDVPLVSIWQQLYSGLKT